ncbi:MAG: ComEC/Rec2 family competence protein [Rhodobacter sp.]|nr:ComEC/Rec2 family competence protein [Rhodobacter sp.]
MAPIRRVLDAIEAQRGHLFPWVPVMLGAGIGAYFALRVEPGPTAYLVLVAGVLMSGAGACAAGGRAAPVLTAVSILLTGFCLAGLRAHLVAAPLLDFRYYGPIEGRVVAIDRSVSDKVRLTLDRVVLEDMPPSRTPERVRVSLHGEQGVIVPEPGLTVILTGHLSPPQGPVEPGGFDFRRMAWFDRLGAVGYTRSPVLALAPANEGAAGLRIHRLRLRISTAVQAELPGESGAFAAAILTGDRSGMGRETLTALRASNLAHLLAISGLHMGLLTGFVFAAFRLILVATPWIGLRVPAKKLAAVMALAAGAFYYALSGGNVATERAYIMVAVMFVAVLFDRRALTLRAVAIAAVIVLALRPETVTEPGFQMSFAATTALVAVFGWLRDWDGPAVPNLLRPVLAVVISSAVAGAATAPVAAAHFNRIADYGLIANLLSVPLMGMLVMPAAVLAAMLVPLGLAGWGLQVMDPPIRWILGVAHRVAALEGAVTPVPAPPSIVLPLLALGLLWVILWRGRLRFAGLAPAAVALAIWMQASRPPVLVADTGGLIGVMTAEGRVLSKPRGDGFAALNWLENDGDGAEQADAAARTGFVPEGRDRRVVLEGAAIVHLRGRGAAARAGAACGSARLVVVGTRVDTTGPCLLYDPEKLRKTGSLAIYPEAGGLRLVTVADVSGERLWSPQ